MPVTKAEMHFRFRCYRTPESYAGGEEWKQVDLSRFNISHLMSSAYDYAYQTGEYWNFWLDEAQDTQMWVGGIPQRDVTGSGYDFMGENGLCRRIADTACARWSLGEGYQLTVRELALLTNITECYAHLAEPGRNFGTGRQAR